MLTARIGDQKRRGGREFGEHVFCARGLHPCQFVGGDANDGQELDGAMGTVNGGQLGIVGERQSGQAGVGCARDWETGRSAEVGDLLDQVQDHRDLARVVEAMRADLLAHPNEWENHTLERYLDGLAALVDSLDSLLANRGEDMPGQPSWALIAQLLTGASGYE